jgi:hypothetical protein
MIPFQGGLVESLDYCSSQDSQIEASCYCFNKKNIDNKDKKKKNKIEKEMQKDLCLVMIYKTKLLSLYHVWLR